MAVKKRIVRALVGTIGVYQKYLSPLMGNGCRFSPTCSHYAITAIEKHGPVKGSMMGVRRILKCHPWSKGGIDPVP